MSYKENAKFKVKVYLPITAPMEYEFLSFDYVLYARNETEAEEEFSELKTKLGYIGADGVLCRIKTE